jgi:hypothetical protein
MSEDRAGLLESRVASRGAYRMWFFVKGKKWRPVLGR